MNYGYFDDSNREYIITDPRTCNFDPSKLQGFRPEQIEALKMIYQGAVNPRTGVQIYPGLEPGGEGPQPGNPGWGLIMNGQTPFAIDNAVLGAMGFNNLSWDWKTFDFDRDVDLTDRALMKTGFSSNISALSPAEKYGKGDCTLDGAINLADVIAFSNAFDAMNGAGSFAALADGLVPEPSTCGLLLLAAGILCGARRNAPVCLT